MTKVKFELLLEMGRCRGECMDIAVSSDIKFERRVISDDLVHYQFELEWPAVIELELSGKNLQTDTVVDVDGNIIANKYIKMIEASINGFRFNERVLYQSCLFSPVGSVAKNEIYWDRNGLVKFEFDSDSPASWNLYNDNVLYFR